MIDDTAIGLPPPERAAAELLARREEEDRQIAILLSGARRPGLTVALAVPSPPLDPVLREEAIEFVEAARYGAVIARRRRRQRERMAPLAGMQGAGFSHLRSK